MLVYNVIDNVVQDQKQKGRYTNVQKLLNRHEQTPMESLKQQLKLDRMKPVKPKKKNMGEEE